MANNKINQDENILVKLDDNNLIYIDPNSVVQDKKVEPRGISPENMVVYVNLEADIIPRTSLTADGDQNKQGSLVSIAEGNINFMRNQNGGDFDTTWTDAFLETKEEKDRKTGKGKGIFHQEDGTAQSFGIESINMTTKGYTVPQVTINFIDVRGKTLFESGPNSPYRAFFHIPWPLFYLTIKGYYGKAIRYRLHLTKFMSKYNEQNGNFEISCTFIGSTYGFLADLPLEGAMTAPFMYYIEKSVTNTTNGNQNTKTITVSKSSKGYQLLDSIYNQYKQKGYLDKSFKTKTLREVITIAKSLNEILEKSIFKEIAHMDIFVGLNEFDQKSQDFETAVNGWANMHLSSEVTINPKTNNEYRYLNKQENNSYSGLTSNDAGSLKNILSSYHEELTKNSLFTQGLINKTGVDFRKTTFNYINNVGSVDSYISKDTNGNIIVNLKGSLTKIYDIQKSFTQQKNKFEQKIQDEINKIIKNPKIGLGFSPTIRNIFAIILANMEVYIKLLQDVHRRAFEVGPERKKLIKNFTDETPNDDNIYPWPLVKKLTAENSQKVMAYPGESGLMNKLQSNNPRLWPEVEFVENYDLVATKKIDTTSNKEAGIGNINFIFENNESDVKIKPISNFLNVNSVTPYQDKTISSVFYEIYERGIHATLYDSFPSLSGKYATVVELANNEFSNIVTSFYEDAEVLASLKTVKGVSRTETTNNTSSKTLENYLYSYSKNDKYNYFLEGLPTTDYIKEILTSPFEISVVANENEKPNLKDTYLELQKSLKNYVVDDYRMYVYPFNSPTYLSYQHVTEINKDQYKFTNLFQVDTSQGLVKSPKNSYSWYKPRFLDTTDKTLNNIFTNQVNIQDSFVNILNTPYFHKQLFGDFSNTLRYGKYKSSAYLLLNSLPYLDLFDSINLGGDSMIMSHLFKEVGSTHYVPYHLMLKWGSIYHRYKTYLLEGEDILQGVTTPITGTQYFDITGGTPTYTVNGVSITYDSTYQNIGFQPFLEGVFYQIVNGSSAHFDLYSPSDYSTKIENNYIYTKEVIDKSGNGVHYWTTFVDSSKYDSTQNYYTLLPTCGGNSEDGLGSQFDSVLDQQNNFRVMWFNDEVIDFTYSAVTFTNYNEYSIGFNSDILKDYVDYTIDGNKRKVIDLIGTFSPQILNQFEKYFLEFASDRENVELPYKAFPDVVTPDKTYVVSYQNFQDLLQALVTVKKEKDDEETFNSLIAKIPERQKSKLTDVTNDIVSEDNLIKLVIANPKEIDYNLYNGYAKPSDENTLTLKPFDNSDYNDNLKYVKLYLGDDNTDTLTKYVNFFQYNDYEITEENVLLLRPLVYMWCGGYETLFNNVGEFKTYIVDKILLPAADRLNVYLTNLVTQFSSVSLEGDKNIQRTTRQMGYNTDPLKIEMYSYFKSFNDKWIGGNSLGQRSLMDEFLFLDRANRDIGDRAYLSLDKLISFEDPNNDKIDLLGALSMLLQDTGFNMLGMPAYVNFYGTDFSKTGKIAPSKKVAKDLFGTYLEVDYMESTPKIIIQYTGPTSKYMNMEDINKKYLFKDDSFNFFDANRNPLRVTVPDVFDPKELNKSNRVVGFEVNIGDQVQSMFKTVSLNQSSLKNTTESFSVLENLSRSESGAATTELDVGLFDLYRTNSYTCDVTCMGNVMIQPTMYFYLKNIPLFRGTYWITEVSHSVKPNNLTTTFKGVRISSMALPDPKESFISSFRTFFDAIVNKAKAKQSTGASSTTPTTEKTITTDKGTATVDQGPSTNKITGETLVKESAIDNFYGLPYNGYKNESYIQKVLNGGEVYYKGTAVLMGGPNYQISDNIEMSLFNKFSSITVTGTTTKGKMQWVDIKGLSKTNDFYSLRFLLNDKNLNKNVLTNILNVTTTFVNPKNLKKGFEVIPIDYQTYGSNLTPNMVNGPINEGPSNSYGIGLSESLMKKLGLKDGDPVYFQFS